MKDNVITEQKPGKSKQECLSKCGKWRSFPKVPNLLQYVSTGTYFARVKVDGKTFRESLKTDVFTTAKTLLPDVIKKHQKSVHATGTFGGALKAYQNDLELDYNISPQTKRYRSFCIKAILESWQGLADMKLSKITPEQCKEWAAKLASEVDEQYWNNILGTFRAILRKGGLEGWDDPSRELKRIGVKPKELPILEPEQFEALLTYLDASSAWKAQKAADMIRFLAFSGCRISEARKVTWADIDFEKGLIRIDGSKARIAASHSQVRHVPMFDDMRELLLRMKGASLPTDRVIPFDDCEKTMTAACAKLGIPRITHHRLRDMFGTRCIQAGVDFATAANWMGHKDKGITLMKIYMHHQQGHSKQMAKLVSFLPKKEGEV